MMQLPVRKIPDFDLDELVYSDIKVLESGAKQAYVNYGPDNERLILQTPRFTLPFNMSVFDKGGPPKYSIEASFRGMESYPKLQEFHDKFQALDEKLITDGMSNSMAWFKKKKTTREVVEALFHKQIKLSRDKISGEPDGRFPPTIRFKLPFRNDKFQFKVYNLGTREEINLGETPLNQLLVKGSSVKALVQCSGLWFASGRFGCTWNVVQLRVRVPARLTTYSFLADSDDEENEDETTQTSLPTSGTQVEDSDDDDDDDDSDSESDAKPVTPVKIVKKRRGRKKKN